jgi:4-aminobutyrate aminotransferase-like enzyme
MHVQAMPRPTQSFQYAAELTKTMPAPLSYVVLTCSGSEANDLALRMCRTITGESANPEPTPHSDVPACSGRCMLVAMRQKH